jgi:hypothetical protein
MAKHYAWSDIYNGGEVKEVEGPTGNIKKVVVNRNITPRGQEVTKAKLGVSDEDWDALIDGGSVRPYPVPEEADEYLSPTQAVLARLTKGTGEIDQDMLLELAMTQPMPINPSSEEAKEVEAKPVGVK